MSSLPGLTAESPRRWLFFALPAIGGLLSGLLVYRFAPEAEGHGTDAMIRAFHEQCGVIRARVPLIKGVAIILTLCTGGSAGKEGPIAQIGGGAGSVLAQELNLTVRDRRILLLAGVAGGLGAIFRAPLGSAITAIEVLYRRLRVGCAHPVRDRVGERLCGVRLARRKYPDLRRAHVLAVRLDPRDRVLDPHARVGSGRTHVRLAVPCDARSRLRAVPLPRALVPMVGGLAVGMIGLLVPRRVRTPASGFEAVRAALVAGHIPRSRSWMEWAS
jgi:chloride channel protein, CIC family